MEVVDEALIDVPSLDDFLYGSSSAEEEVGVAKVVDDFAGL